MENSQERYITTTTTNNNDNGIVSAKPRVKIKESEKIDKYLDLAREPKTLGNVTVIPVVTGTLTSIPKGFKRGLEEIQISGRIESIQTTT